ncbi:MAG: hypothetical protein DHS20C15_24440 [Planctomycetota bacterium]|nr:MAG: hypothetical protein DHS20C15_24440 [Planctomycetota bacterium]
MNRITRRITDPPRRQAGFTLPEALVAGVLGAMLLMAVAQASVQFTLGVSHLEEKAGINADETSAMQQMTRDIREAWYALQPSDDHIQLANPEGGFLEYFLEDGNVKLLRPNGDVGTVAFAISSLNFEASYVERYREGVVSNNIGAWYDRDPSGFSTNIKVESGDAIAMAFVVPYHEEDLPSGSVTDEHLSSAELDVLALPLAFVPGTLPESLQIELYPARAPGSARPYGSPVASLSVPGTSLPQAVWDSSDWEAVTVDALIDLSSFGDDLVPGDAYTLRLLPTGDSELLVQGFPTMVSSDDDDVDYQSGGGSYVTLPVSVPLTLSGDYVLSNTTTHQMISGFFVTLAPEGKLVQKRSAVLMSQSLSDDPWFGVVPGDTPP